MLFIDTPLTGFSTEFLRDYDVAEKRVDDSKSAEPLLVLLEKYINAAERAELEVSTGLAYGQGTGMLDPAKAAAHFTGALQYELPERTEIAIMMARGNAQEQVKKTTEALRD